MQRGRPVAYNSQFRVQITRLRERFEQIEIEHAMNLAGDADAEIGQIGGLVAMRESVQTAQARFDELQNATEENRNERERAVREAIRIAQNMLRDHEFRQNRVQVPELVWGEERPVQNELNQIEKENSTVVKWRLRINDTEETLFSRMFSIPTILNAKFALFLDLEKFSDDSPHFYGLILKEAQNLKPFNLKIKCWFGNTDDQKTGIEYQDFHFKNAGDKVYFNDNPDGAIVFFKRALMREASFYICCKIQHPTVEQTSNHAVLGNKLWELYQQGIGYDAIIETADGKEFKVMSAVLMSHSDAFKIMFSENYKEGKEKRVKIEDISSDVMEVFICWLYTGQLNDNEVIDDLFAVADKYIIEELKSKCANIISNNLTEKNAAKYLVLAINHSDKELETKIMRFVSKLESSKIKEVFEAKEWLDYLLAKEQREDLEPRSSSLNAYLEF